MHNMQNNNNTTVFAYEGVFWLKIIYNLPHTKPQ